MTETGNESSNANGNANDNKSGNTDSTSKESETKTLTMTQDELNKIITDRLDKERRAWEKRLSEKDKEDKDKAELEKLQGEEKLKKQHQLEIEKLQQERDTYSRDLKIARAQATLSAKGLDAKFAEHLIGATDEETNANIDNFAKMVDDQVAKTIKANTVKGAPPAPGSSTEDPIRAQIRAGFGLKN